MQEKKQAEQSPSPKPKAAPVAEGAVKRKFPDDWYDSVIVRQCQIDAANGGVYEVPNTTQIQTYDPAYFDKITEAGFFSECKMKVEVLHDPRH